MKGLQQNYEHLARLAAALGNPLRLRAMHLLFQKERSVEELAAELGASVANTAAHLKVLRDVELVRAERRGKYIYQHLQGEAPLQLFLALRQAGEELLPEMKLLDAQCGDDSLAPWSPEQLAEQLDSLRVTLTDLRPLAEYEAGHLPGARNIPFAELEAQLSAWSQRKVHLVYCRGKYCPKALQGAALLRRTGRKVQRLGFGVPEWRASGLALQQGAEA